MPFSKMKIDINLNKIKQRKNIVDKIEKLKKKLLEI